MISDLYYECHVTVDTEFAKGHLDLFTKISEMYDFRVASFLMFIHNGEPKAFTTGRAKSRAEIEMRMLGICRALKANGFKVLRYKIEDTLLDSKQQGDVMGVL